MLLLQSTLYPTAAVTWVVLETGLIKCKKCEGYHAHAHHSVGDTCYVVVWPNEEDYILNKLINALNFDNLQVVEYDEEMGPAISWYLIAVQEDISVSQSGTST